MARRGAVALLLAVAGIALVVAAGPPAAARQEPAGAIPRLVGQSPWLAESQPFVLRFTYAGGLPADGSVELTLYGAVTARETIVRGVADPALLGPVRDELSVPTAIVPRGDDGSYRLQIATDGSTAGFPVDDPGVYPLHVSVAGAEGQPGRTMLTFIVRPPEDAAAAPLRAAVVLPLHAPPSFDPDGEPGLSPRAQRLLDVRASLLARHRSVPLTVVPTPELLDAAARVDPELVAGVREALATRHVVAGPYVRLDLGAFANVVDLLPALDDQFEAGSRTLRRVLRRQTDGRTWVGAGNPTSGALDALARAGVDRALFREESVAGADVPIDEPVVVTGATGQALDATLADAALRTYVHGADPVLMAHRTFADLALQAAPPDDGGVATGPGGGGVVVELPANRPLPAAYLDALLRVLGTGGPVRPVTLAALFDDPAGAGDGTAPPALRGVPLAGQDLTTYGQNLAATQRTVDGYTSFAGGVDPLGEDLRRRLLVSGSVDLTEDGRGAYLRSTSRSIEDRTALVQVSDQESITLTSREGDIPVTLHNETGGPVQVELRFDTDNKLDFPDGATQTVRLPEGATRVVVPVVARASGSFPLRITATSPGGALTVTRARLTVRSTAVSGVGMVLSIGALLVLVVWWARHWRDARRNRRLVDPEDLPVDTDPGGNAQEPAPV